MVYGSVQPQIKEALAGVRKLYEEKLLDDSFMLRTMTNIAELIIDGKCGSFFGPWWAPNNPLMEAMEKNPDAVWEPYLIRTTEDGKLQYYDQNPSYKYVVVRKDFEHPEIVFKMASVMFDKMRTEGQDNEELAYYFQTNVDSTARPISINIDYSDALHRCYEDINAALTGKKDPDELHCVPALQPTPYTSKPCLRRISARIRLSFNNPTQVAIPIFFALIFFAKSMISSTRVCLQ